MPAGHDESLQRAGTTVKQVARREEGAAGLSTDASDRRPGRRAAPADGISRNI